MPTHKLQAMSILDPNQQDINIDGFTRLVLLKVARDRPIEIKNRLTQKLNRSVELEVNLIPLQTISIPEFFRSDTN